MIQLEKNNLEEVIKDGIYIVDFYADWCEPCKMLGSILETLDSSVNIIKVNVDKLSDIVFKYRIMSIPTLIFYKDGVKKEETVGIKSKEEIESIVSRLKNEK